MTELSINKLKKQLLELLKKDEEFRYAIAGLIGIEEVLRELRKLREDFNRRMEFLEREMLEHSKRFEAIERKMLEHDKRFEEMNKRFEVLERKLLEHDKRFEALERKLLEHDKRFEALERKLLEHDKRFEAIERKLLEHDKRFETIEKRLEEHSRILQEHSRRIEELTRAVMNQGRALEKLASSIQALGYRYGIFTEEAFRESMKYVLEDLLKEYKVDKWIYYDSNGIVFGYPSWIEVDVLIKDEIHVLVEYKASVDKGDVAEIYRIGKLYEEVKGIKPRLIIVSPAIRKRAKELAEKLGIEVRGVMVEV